MAKMADLSAMRVPSGWDAFPLALSHVTAIRSIGGLSYDDVAGVRDPGRPWASDDLSSERTDAAFFAVGGSKVAGVVPLVGGARVLQGPSHDALLARVQTVRRTFRLSEIQPAPFSVGIDEPMTTITWDNVLFAEMDVRDER